jgi:hypothetical protein
MKEELKEKYDSYLASKKGTEVHSFMLFFIVSWIIIDWLPLLIIFSNNFGAMISIWVVIFFVSLIILKKTPSAPIESPEDTMFLNLCDVLKNIEFYFENPKSEIHLTRASKSLRRFLSLMKRMIREESYSVITRMIDEPLQKLANNIEKRILPLIRYSSSQKDIQIAYSRLEPLAFMFKEPATIAKSLDICNQLFEDIQEPKIPLIPTFRDRLANILRTHENLRFGLVALAIFIGCCIFYYVLVSYLEIPKEYALTVNVAIFIGLLTIYSRKKSKE